MRGRTDNCYSGYFGINSVVYGRAALLLLLAAFAISFSQASIPVTYEVIALGGTNPHGIKPRAGLVLGPDGNYYGTTSDGGESAGGTVFKLTPDGVLTALAAFTQTHGNPSTTPIVGFDGNLYGTTNGAPDGLPGTSTIYRVSLAGALEIIASFPNGDSPPGLNKLVQGSDGNFYGTTTRGGANGRGSVFQLTPGGTFTTLLSFAASEGIPRAGLVAGDDGNFYGTTYFGGANGAGMVFRITPAGALTPLHSFSTSAPSFGFNPVTELTKASDGSFYGVTRGGGANNVGVIFRVTAAGELTSVASVPRGDSINGDPNPVAFGEDGNLYGTTREHFYRVSPDGTVTTLVNFAQNSGGRLPYGSLLKTGDGAFLGTAITGGITGVNEIGVVHRLSETGAVTQVAAFQNVVGRWFCSELSEGADGELYGGVAYDLRPFAFNQSTSHAGAFKVSLSGQATGLRSFRNAYYPGTPSRMIQAFGGELYGTYAHGGGPSGNGGGFIFRLTVSGSITQVYQFTSSL
ncbi:MAG TPA: choice-of-anchor tandem repeat GloVer-containing protein, partial [Chthoniobacterales bacterium]|nr:choice-of-anchor tandem repeat GloVer-containing protein [Chthoniobacterales bacterium]